MQKRKRSIQGRLNLQVLQEAENEAKLEESIMEEEILSKEKKVYKNRRHNIRLKMAIATARKKMRLKKLAAKVKSVLDRLAFASGSLQANSAKQIQLIEDQYSREKAANEEELHQMAREEETREDNNRQLRTERQSINARDTTQAEEDLVAGIQANEDLLSDEEDREDEEDELDEQQDE